MREYIVKEYETFPYKGAVKELPQLIRCKDCKYYGRVDKRRFYRGEDCMNGHISTIVPEKDFCSRAERK